MIPDLTIRRAGPNDAEAVHDLLVEVATWLESRGIRQWAPSIFTLEGIRRSCEEQEVYLAYAAAGEPAGTLRIQWSDPFFWGAGSGEDNAAYIHRVAVARSYSGQGVGLIMLAWAEDYARSQGKRLLRLDCMPDNTRLVQYYVEAGFQLIGEQTLENGWRAALFEKGI